MQATTTVLSRRAAISLAALAVLFAAAAVALDAAYHVPLRLPGHRALPGAVALILFAEAAPVPLLLGFAAVVPLAVVALGGGTPWLVVPWLAVAALLAGLRSERWRGAVWFLAIAGLLFGALRAGVLQAGVHATPDILRWGGHLAFGAAGGLLAALIRRVHRSTEDER